MAKKGFWKGWTKADERAAQRYIRASIKRACHKLAKDPKAIAKLARIVLKGGKRT